MKKIVLRNTERKEKNMHEIITMQNIHKIYNPGINQVAALSGIDLHIQNGEFTAIIGSSGSGKSTLMNIMGCLDTPDKGDYYLAGVNTSKLSEKQLSDIRSRKIGFIFQKFNLIPTLSALENVELPMLYMGYSQKQRKQRSLEALEIVGLKDRIRHKPGELSGGQQQRVAIARAVAANPEMILADEPTGNLDSAAGNAVIALLKKLNQDGKTIVLITHDEKTAAAATRKITVSDGKIIG